ncbi:TPA: Rieske (2Fe-2S) protein [Pseudomonas putida]|nr:Rieske (2Fe-2S) protein [Pseudomonas putida]
MGPGRSARPRGTSLIRHTPVTLCHIDELPDGQSCGFDPHHCGQDSVLVVRRGGQVHVYRNACPHHDTPLAWRKDAYLNAARDRIICFAHGAQFEIETGRCVLGPCLGQCLAALPFFVDEEGKLLLL